jgi:hypothetical protein
MFKASPAILQTFTDTRLTLTPSVIPNSTYVITVSDWNSLKYFCMFFFTVIIRCTETLYHPVYTGRCKSHLAQHTAVKHTVPSTFCLAPTNCMQHSPSEEANRSSACQEIPRRSITSFTGVRNWSLSSARSIQHTAPQPNSSRSILILSSHLRLSSKWSLYITSPHQNPVYTSPRIHTCCMPRPSHSSRFDHSINVWSAVQNIKFLIMYWLEYLSVKTQQCI